MTEKKPDDFMAMKSFTKAEVKFEIGNQQFTMKPLVPKKLRVLIELIEKSGTGLEGFTEFKDMVTFVLDKIVDIFPIIFDAKINQTFADENISVPLCMEIWEQFVKLNRLESILPFFSKIIKITKEDKVNIKESPA